jgi:hypothetical protein
MKHFAFILVAASLFFATVAVGQPPNNQPPNNQPPNKQSPRERLNKSFESKSPSVGEQLPNLEAYNAAGETIRLGELKGDYTVLVFGCLT